MINETLQIIISVPITITVLYIQYKIVSNIIREANKPVKHLHPKHKIAAEMLAKTRNASGEIRKIGEPLKFKKP